MKTFDLRSGCETLEQSRVWWDELTQGFGMHCERLNCNTAQRDAEKCPGFQRMESLGSGVRAENVETMRALGCAANQKKKKNT